MKMNRNIPSAFPPLFRLLLCASFFGPIFPELSTHFRQFLDSNYGQGVGEQMARMDMGQFIGGSFGGKLDDEEAIGKEPVIFIHGVTLRAGVFMAHRNYFIDRGYSPAELYATTYSDGGQTPFYRNQLECQNVKQIRSFIIAVHEYANKSVDIIAYSMGVAISRKAILGGLCVDTGEDLGDPLTSSIDTFVSIGGVAYGMEWFRCPQNLPACNTNNGMICTSAFMRDVNKPTQRYEGANSYGIYSRDDTIVGQECCGHPCSELKNANLTIARRFQDHITIFTRTVPLQYALVTNHTAIDN